MDVESDKTPLHSKPLVSNHKPGVLSDIPILSGIQNSVNLQTPDEYGKENQDKESHLPKKRKYGPENPTSAKSELLKSSVKAPKNIFTETKDEVWVPPENQTGDGKTHLNEKFGY
ncbi:hypothetical protein BB559_006967 [Furculomyces boomerangus]|uniref:Uncharacterized protein n=2 Tax=Harpellales TaxID=61421 RepID=A0A2T9XZV3_9FUNG|nr:hypothetical protein BB559_006967 [Furculomyces boomerangus]